MKTYKVASVEGDRAPYGDEPDQPRVDELTRERAAAAFDVARGVSASGRTTRVRRSQARDG